MDNPCNDLANAVRDMELMHVTYLNKWHDPAVLEKWRETAWNIFLGSVRHYCTDACKEKGRKMRLLDTALFGAADVYVISRQC